MRPTSFALVLLAGCGGATASAPDPSLSESDPEPRTVWTGDVSEDEFVRLRTREDASEAWEAVRAFLRQHLAR